MTAVNAGISVRMEPKIRAIKDAEQTVERIRRQMGPSEAVGRFLSRYAKIRTQKAYAIHLQLYLRWLKEEGVGLTPDELIQDNLNCVYGAQPQDVRTKRKHTDLLHKYVNVYLLGLQRKESHRRLAFTTVKMFYKKNDSPLFGDMGVSSGSPEVPPEALPAEDVRKVLRLLPFSTKLACLIEWQSGMEVNRVLGLKWKSFEKAWKEDGPLKIELFGRKTHRRPYHTFVGRDSVELVKVWHERWKAWMKREPLPDELVFLSKRRRPLTPNWVNLTLKETAKKLAAQDLIKARDLSAWHSHALRHSFKTQGEHAGVPSDMVELWMGHDGGIKRIYDNRDETHAEDFVRAYRKLEPYISLEFNEAILEERFEEERKNWIIEIASLRRDLARYAGLNPPGPRASEESKPGQTFGS